MFMYMVSVLIACNFCDTCIHKIFHSITLEGIVYYILIYNNVPVHALHEWNVARFSSTFGHSETKVAFYRANFYPFFLLRDGTNKPS
jgi:hypothetical protein